MWDAEARRGAVDRGGAGGTAGRLGIDVTFAEADLLEGVEGPFDAVLSNLPYVAEGVGLEPEISDYEPPVALFGGPDGLDQIKRLVQMARGVPLVAMEVGLAEWVSTLLERAGFSSTEILNDLAGRQRGVVARA